jgi:hypothetical protein
LQARLYKGKPRAVRTVGGQIDDCKGMENQGLAAGKKAAKTAVNAMVQLATEQGCVFRIATPKRMLATAGIC